MIGYEHARTLAVVRELAQGKMLRIGGYTVAMGEDMSIGIVMVEPESGDSWIGGMSTMDLAQLNKLLNEHGVGMPVVEGRR